MIVSSPRSTAAESDADDPQPQQRDRRRLVAQIHDGIRNRAGDLVQNLSVQIGDAGVVLTGTTDSFYGKQLAQSVAMAVLSREPVVNRIVVR